MKRNEFGYTKFLHEQLFLSASDLKGRIRERSSFSNTQKTVLLWDAWGNESDSWVLGSVGEWTINDVERVWDVLGGESSTAEIDDVTSWDACGSSEFAVIRDNSNESTRHLLDWHWLGDHSLETWVFFEILRGQRHEDGVFWDGNLLGFDNFLTFEPDTVEIVDERVRLDWESASINRGIEHETREVRWDSIISTGEEVVHVLEFGEVVSGDDVISSVPASELLGGGERRLDDSIMVWHDGVGVPGFVFRDGGLRDVRLNEIRDILWFLRSLDFRKFVVRNVRFLWLRNGLLSDVDSFGFQVLLEWNVHTNVVGSDGGGHEVFSVVEFVDLYWFDWLADFDRDGVNQQVVSFIIFEDWEILLLELIGIAFFAESGVDAESFLTKVIVVNGTDGTHQGHQDERLESRFHL